jgi:hypothetical protein
MNRITSLAVKTLVLILIGSGPLAINLHSQSNLTLTFRIPFQFTAGMQSIAPGTYEFRLLSNEHMLSVLNMKTGHEEVFPVRPESRRSMEPRGRLIFRNSEGCSVLKEVHFPGTNMLSEVIPRHGEERIEAKRPSKSDSVSVARR